MRKRSKYRPKPLIINTMEHVRFSVAPVAALGDQLLTLRIRNHDALASLAQGKATRQELDVIIAALNVAEALCMQDVGEQYRQQLREGQDALKHVCERARHIATGPELTAINWAMELHDAQLEVITVAQLERAVAKVAAIIKGGGARLIESKT